MKFSSEDLDSVDGVGGEGDLDLSADAPTSEPASMSLMGGIARPEGMEDAGDLDFASMDQSSKLLTKSTMLVVLVVLIAAGALYAMRMTQGDGKPDDALKKAEARIATLLGDLKKNGDQASKLTGALDDTQVMLDVLDHDPTKAQVPIEYTKQNPFALLLPDKKDSNVLKPINHTPKVDPVVEARKRLLKKANEVVAKMKLQSVVPNGARSLAIINNKIVQLNGVVETFESDGKTVAFKVIKVQNVSVVLEAAGKIFTLSLAK
jgi:hypothetical protein